MMDSAMGCVGHRDKVSDGNSNTRVYYIVLIYNIFNRLFKRKR